MSSRLPVKQSGSRSHGGKSRSSANGGARVAALEALNRKLSALQDAAYPYESADRMPLDIGDEPIMVLDLETVHRTRARAYALSTQHTPWNSR